MVNSFCSAIEDLLQRPSRSNSNACLAEGIPIKNQALRSYSRMVALVSGGKSLIRRYTTFASAPSESRPDALISPQSFPLKPYNSRHTGWPNLRPSAAISRNRSASSVRYDSNYRCLAKWYWLLSTSMGLRSDSIDQDPSQPRCCRKDVLEPETQS